MGQTLSFTSNTFATDNKQMKVQKVAHSPLFFPNTQAVPRAIILYPLQKAGAEICSDSEWTGITGHLPAPSVRVWDLSRSFSRIWSLFHLVNQRKVPTPLPSPYRPAGSTAPSIPSHTHFQVWGGSEKDRIREKKTDWWLMPPRNPGLGAER